VEADLPGVPPAVLAGHAVASIRVALDRDADVACALADYALAQLAAQAPAALLAARAAALRAAGRPGWDTAARDALAAARRDGDPAAERLAGAALVAGLRDSCQVGEARRAAEELAARAAGEGAYGVEVGFRAEALWAAMQLADGLDGVLRAAAALADRAAPAGARALLLATLALAHADTGGLPTARALLGRAGPAGPDRTVRWVTAEAAWLDGDPAGARRAAAGLGGVDLPAGLAAVTAQWCGQDTGEPVRAPAELPPGPVADTVAAWAAGTPEAFTAAADGWTGVMARERVRCLLAAGLAGPLPPLLEAERLAGDAGLATLLGRVRRALRDVGVVRRPTAGAGALSPREREVLALVGRGLSTRRIAELLGITRHTAETYVKSGMGKLGARTRTEAAVRAAALPAAAGA
jgi:DNA-binding CsgD family transcriptional regulator